MKTIDAKGLNCPLPVVLAKKEMDAGQTAFLIVVDNQIACENLQRFADSQGYQLLITPKNGYWDVVFTKDSSPCAPAEPQTSGTQSCAPHWVVFIGNRTIGNGDPELGSSLMKMFFYTLSQSDDLPKAVLFMNEGVKLAAQDPQIIEHLTTLSQKGVNILVCGTCLNFYHLSDPLPVGTVSNMYEILLQMQQADKVVSF